MAPSSIAKTAVITPFGLWEFLRMPFGLKNAAQSFQRLMEGILRDLSFAFVYLGGHFSCQPFTLRTLSAPPVTFQPSFVQWNGYEPGQACFWCFQTGLFRPSCQCRGNHPTSGPYNSPPRQQCAWRSHKPTVFLGMINYYHRFLPGIGAVLAPLHSQANGKGQHIDWSKECQNAFNKVKEVLSETVLLHHPQPNAPTSLTVDASNTAIGAQLEQRQGGAWVPLAFFSRKLSNSEKKYSAFDRRLLASYGAI
ncbi:hypothetical protein RRG08_034890 [Elysia crispata]|uniref:Reverse transcriptase/retrotransposon-derived protein RNase H-like domain-containing protein n=1 Tax=Elysia crispata TaxID=231223 RepID=A0AAE0ZTL9_9GAST|nr:hypothetical protein RRG08_034890 [Elysia crispata]